MRRLVILRAALVAALVLTGVCAGTDARADGLTVTEQARLANHETVARSQTLEREDRRYIGGVTYTVLDAPPSDVAAVIDDADALQKVLPRTKTAHFTGRLGGDRLLEVTQGNALMEATYTVRIKRDPSEARFWLEPSLPHGIEDAWGFFRWQPWGDNQTLLTYAILVDVGPGIVRDFFEDRFRAALLSVPQHVRRELADRTEAVRVRTASYTTRD
ncbi:MAG: hypothetical protein U0270_35965 [Labilithrix sp.]